MFYFSIFKYLKQNILKKVFIFLKILCLLAFLIIGFLQKPILASEKIGAGFTENVEYLRDKNQLIVSGWASTEHGHVFITSASIYLNDQTIYRGRIEKHQRPDVVEATQRDDWLWTGFRVVIPIPHNFSEGIYSLHVKMHLGNGSTFDLETSEKAKTIEIKPLAYVSPKIQFLLLFSIILPVSLLLLLPYFERKNKWSQSVSAFIFGSSVIVSFILLVVLGITGSSLIIGLEKSPFIQHDARLLSGELKYIRSDEWQAITPMAISQIHHKPAFPIINKNLGPDGQNMMVVGMTGVPVAHISSLGKPATWGFFTLPLRQALSWYWWFPFFSCFLALWVLLIRFFKLDWHLSAALSITTVAAPYSIGFSAWPAYTAFFPLFGLIFADMALQTKKLFANIIYGFLIGIALTGFVLVLYPAWQISIGYFLGLFGIISFIKRKNNLFFSKEQIICLCLAFIVALTLLLSWWFDAQEAISTIKNTIYPGQRSIEVGGDIDSWFFAKGLLSAITVYRHLDLMNQSDAGSFIFLLFPIMAFIFLYWIKERKIDKISVFLMAFLIWVLAFIFVGFPVSLARLTLWSSTTSYRMDLVLGLVQTFLLAYLFTTPSEKYLNQINSKIYKFIAILLSVSYVTYIFYLFTKLPSSISDQLLPSVSLYILMAIGFLTYYLLTLDKMKFILLYALWVMGSSILFNPIVRAPTFIKVDSNLTYLTKPFNDNLQNIENNSKNQGIIVLGGRPMWSMLLTASGLPVLNGVFYHPQWSLWEKLDPLGQHRALYNRYQNQMMGAIIQPKERDFQIQSTQLDEVFVAFDPIRFDFSKLNVKAVMASPNEANHLIKNPSLRQKIATNDWVLFDVAYQP